MLLYPPALNGNVLLRFPCGRDKRPLTTHGFHDATNVSGILTEWWRRWPTALCGVPTGAVSDFDVLDIDPRNGGDQWFYGNHTRLPRTRTHQTASGGLHLIFQHATGLRCSSGTIAAGIDVRSTGGYVIWWPASGLPVVSDAPVVPWPDWLLNALKSEAVKSLGMGVPLSITVEETPIFDP